MTGAPLDLIDDAQVSLPDLFATHARHHAEKEAVVCGPVRRSWGDFVANINRVANRLIEAGLEKDDAVAVMMGNSVEMLECVFGVVRAGGCVVPLSGLLTGDQLIGLVADSGAVAAIASADFEERLGSRRRAAPAVRRWLSFGFEAEGWAPLAGFLDGASAATPPVRHQPSDRFNIIYSSGTTGLPKGIVQTHRARLHWAFSNAVEMGFSSDARALTTTALYSNGTWLMMLPVLFAGGTLVAMPSFDPAAFLAQVPAERITHTFMVPAQYQMVLARPELAAADLSSLRTVLSAGSPLRRDVKRQVVERISPRLIELYGFSEGFATMLKPEAPAAKFATVGTPVLGFEVKILDDEGREASVGTPGEIAGYGAGLMKGYHNRPEETAALIWRDARGRSFVRSGDVGSLDADGYLTLLDRKKDMIISGGFNVFPSDVEAIVGGHPEVADVAVIGAPHETWGESCVALVIPSPGAAADAAAIRDWSNERLAKHQRLAAVEFRDAFPRNALGKVLKRILREPYWREPTGS